MVAPLEWLKFYSIDKSLAVVGADLSTQLKVVYKDGMRLYSKWIEFLIL
jgi:hypothetical protein